MLKLTPTPEIKLTLAGHIFQFKRLTWREEVLFSKNHPQATRRGYTAASMSSVDGLPVTYEQAHTILKALPRPICDRVIIYYMGSLPTRRKFAVAIPYSAPEAAQFTKAFEEEEETEESKEEEAMNQMFGKEEVAEAQALARKMVGLPPKEEVPDRGTPPARYHHIVA